jgi:hypothetical protein
VIFLKPDFIMLAPYFNTEPTFCHDCWIKLGLQGLGILLTTLLAVFLTLLAACDFCFPGV